MVARIFYGKKRLKINRFIIAKFAPLFKTTRQNIKKLIPQFWWQHGDNFLSRPINDNPMSFSCLIYCLMGKKHKKIYWITTYPVYFLYFVCSHADGYILFWLGLWWIICHGTKSQAQTKSPPLPRIHKQSSQTDLPPLKNPKDSPPMQWLQK